MNIRDFAMMEPMKYYMSDDVNNKKRQAILDNINNEYMATEKHDGCWGMFIHYSKGNNLIRSRSISKVTGAYGDYTAKLPHLCREMDNWPDNTVVLAEICWDEYGTNANTVGTILRCLPNKAVERQKDKKLSALVFDLLMWNNEDFTNKPYQERYGIARTHFRRGDDDTRVYYFNITNAFYRNFASEADLIINNGGEGLVIQRKDNPYMPGTRTAWATLKLKQTLPHMDLKVVGTLEPNKQYDGDCIDTWKYWEVDDTILTSNPPQQGHSLYETMGGADSIWKINGYSHRAVTKPYFMGWKNGITVMLPSGIATDVTSGLTDDDRAYLATPEAQAKIAAGELWAEVKAMSVNDLGKLRHGSLVRLRIIEDGVNDKGE